MIEKLYFDIPIFKCAIRVYRFNKDDKEEMGKYLMKKYNMENALHNVGSFVYDYRNGRVMICIEKDNHAYIAHEIYHLCCAIADWIEWKDIKSEQEPFAYLVEYVTKKIYNSKYKAVKND